jgi:uncharacterized protein (TIGR03067 family)
MKRHLFIVAAALGLLAADEAKDDREAIQGTWKVVATEDSGRETPPEALKNLKIKWVITKDKITYQVGKMTTAWSYTLDPAKKPKWIDLTESGRPMLGVYELDGDTLKVCYPEAVRYKGRRSTALESKPDSVNDVLVVLKREKR